MTRGGKFLVATAVLAVTACGMDQGKLDIRSTPSVLARGTRPIPQRIAEARGQLALGNVGLALEAYRIAWREDENSIDALAGMADCYDRMGRFDLSRRYYETALSIAPADTKLLGAFAASLQLQGLNDEAQSVRQEIAARSAPPAPTEHAPLIVAQPAPGLALRAPAPTPAPDIAAMTLASPAVGPLSSSIAGSKIIVEQAPAPAPEPEFAPIPRPQLAATALGVTENYAPGRVAMTMAAPTTVELAAEAPSAPQPEAPPAAAPAIGRSVTVRLPEAREAIAAPVAAIPAAVPQAQTTASVHDADPFAPVATAEVNLPPPLQPYSRPTPEPSLVKESGPRLERLSLGEIGLVTAPGPMWRATTVAQSERSTTVRFVPLREASNLSVKVRLLNAARVNRLAATTRNWLIARGWRGMAIGNAYASRARSVILYSADTRWLAQRLSKQFGFPMAPKSTSHRQVMVLLGADAARHPALKRRG